MEGRVYLKFMNKGRVVVEDWMDPRSEQVLVGRKEFMEYMENVYLKYGDVLLEAPPHEP